MAQGATIGATASTISATLTSSGNPWGGGDQILVPAGTIVQNGWSVSSGALGGGGGSLSVAMNSGVAPDRYRFQLVASVFTPVGPTYPNWPWPNTHYAGVHGTIALSLTSSVADTYLVKLTGLGMVDVDNDGVWDVVTPGTPDSRGVLLDTAPRVMRVTTSASATAPYGGVGYGGATLTVDIEPARCATSASTPSCGMHLEMFPLGPTGDLLSLTSTSPGRPYLNAPTVLVLGFQPQALQFPFLPGCSLLVAPVAERAVLSLGRTATWTLDASVIPGPFQFLVQACEGFVVPPSLLVQTAEALTITCR